MMSKMQASNDRLNYPEPADPYSRVGAKIFDLLFAAILGRFLGVPGMLMGLLYLLAADGLPGGQSLGKRILNLRVVFPRTGLSIGVKQSTIRNANLAVIYFLALIPIIGTILAIVLGVFVLVVEMYAIFYDPHGLRFGDLLADTEVVSYKTAKVNALNPTTVESPTP